MNKKIICDVCGKTIRKNEQVAVFTDDVTPKYTHVLNNDNEYDCDYRYMMEQLSPHFYSNPNDIEDEDEEI